jgi:hypothetical protein
MYNSFMIYSFVLPEWQIFCGDLTDTVQIRSKERGGTSAGRCWQNTYKLGCPATIESDPR